MTLHRARELGAIVLLDPEEAHCAFVKTGVPGTQRCARKRDHRAAETQPRPKTTAGSHAAQRLKLRFVGGASGVAKCGLVFHRQHG